MQIMKMYLYNEYIISMSLKVKVKKIVLSSNSSISAVVNILIV